jgi:hypothetical protein
MHSEKIVGFSDRADIRFNPLVRRRAPTPKTEGFGGTFAACLRIFWAMLWRHQGRARISDS